MFEIGSALREARERRGLSLSQVEADTKIRSRYIRALEDENFELLPGGTYAKGFLRAYADYLGLDGHLFIDEFTSRHFDPRRELDQPIAPRPRSRPARGRRESNLVVIALAAIVAVSALVFLLALGGKSPPANLPTAPPPSTPSTGGQPVQPGAGTTGPSKPVTHRKPKAYAVTLVSTTNCYITVNAGWPSGPAVSSVHGSSLVGFTMIPGQPVSFTSKRPVYLTLGAPSGVTVTIGSHRARLPQAPPGTVLRVTRKGITRA
jgi:cytoskeleton protein RodZ